MRAFTVGRGADTEGTAEGAGKIGGGFEAAFGGDLRDGEGTFGEQGAGTLHTEIIEIGERGHAEDGFDSVSAFFMMRRFGW